MASDGGIFAFGDGQFHGSLGGSSPAHTVIGLFTAHGVSGYTLVDADGTATPFG